MMKCPVCNAIYRPSKPAREILQPGQEEPDNLSSIPNSPSPISESPSYSCRRCGAELSALIELHDRALWYYKRALNFFAEGNYAEAKASNEQALALHRRNADFHALAGRLAALEGEFIRAIASWQQALKLDPQHQTASQCLDLVRAIETQLNETSV